MKTKFTKGEWHLGHPTSGSVFCVPPQDGIVKPEEIFIAAVYPHDTNDTTEIEERLANTKLIAAAPDLLEALIAIEYDVKEWGEYNELQSESFEGNEKQM